MFLSKKITLSAVALFTALVSTSQVRADQAEPVGLPVLPRPVGLPIGKMVPPRPVGLPIGKMVPPRPVGLPIGKVVPPRPPVVGLPRPRPPHPPVVGMPRPPVVGLPLPPQPPTVGMPIFPSAEYLLECNAVRGNLSGIDRLKLHIKTGYRAHEVNGSVKYFDGSRANIRTTATGGILRGQVDLNLYNVGTIELRPMRKLNSRVDLRGEVSLFGHSDRFGLSCEIDRD